MNIIRKIFAPIYFRKNVSIGFAGSLERGIERLSGVVAIKSWRSLFKEQLIGKVSESKVEIWRYQPLLHNSFIPVFKGRFLMKDGTATLEGEFAMHRFARLFIPIWVVGLLIVCATLSVVVRPGSPPGQSFLPILLVPLGMACFGVGLLHVGWAIGKYDIAYIEKALTESLNGESVC